MDRRSTFLICLFLAAATLATYWPVTHFGFVNYDDPKYVVAVFMRNAGHGGQMAAPPAAQILEVLMSPKEPPGK